MAVRLSSKAKVGAGVGAAFVLALSPEGARQLKVREGLVLAAYPDPATRNHPNLAIRGKPWTICKGATGTIYYDGKAVIVQKGLTLTEDQCRQVDRVIEETYRAGLATCIKRQLNQNQSDGLISFAVNVGVPGTCGGSVARLVNAGDFAGAGKIMLQYSCARTADTRYPKAHCGDGRRQMPGLLDRRKYEASLLIRSDTLLPSSTEDRMAIANAKSKEPT